MSLRHVARLALLIGLIGCGASRGDPGAVGDEARRPTMSGPEGEASVRRTFPLRRELGLVTIDARLPGVAEPARFIFDTGAPFVIAPELAERSQAASAGAMLIQDPAGRRGREALVVLERVLLGDLVIRDVEAVRIWPSPPNPVCCVSQSGLFGATALRAGIWQLDFEAEQIIVTTDRALVEVAEGAVDLPFRVDRNGVPFIEVDLGGVRASAAVDLGSTRFLEAPRALVDRAGLSITADTPTVEGAAAATVYGLSRTTTHRVEIPRVVLGAEVDWPLVLESAPLWTSEASSLFQIGVDFFEHFQVTIDWERQRLHLVQQSRPTDRGDLRPTLGFFASLRGQEVAVSTLWREGAAARAGLRLGDRLLAVGPRRLDAADWTVYCDLVRDLGGREGLDPVELQITRDGQEQRLRVSPAIWPGR